MFETKNELKISGLLAEDMISLISQDVRVHEGCDLFRHLLRFAEFNNNILLNRCVVLWGKDAGEIIFKMMLDFFLKNSEFQSNYWKTVNIVLKIVQSQNFIKNKNIIDDDSLCAIKKLTELRDYK